MKREVFNKGFAVLIVAFSYVAERLNPDTQEIYWQDLKDISDKDFQAGVDWCRHHSEFFPSIAKLGAACFNGNEGWHEQIVRKKRLAFEHRMNRLDPPMSEEKRHENKQRLAEMANNVGKNMSVKP